ncbi:MAG: FecCD family ABC transporter permease, partial [Turicibacter sp.]
TWLDVEMLFGYSMIGLAMSLLLIRSANVLQLGEESATNLGYNVNKTRLIICIVAVFLAATSTAVVGIISFVGLIVPHIARMIMGSDHKYTIPFSIVLGGIVLLVADTLGRTIGGAVEIPVGVIMAIVGGPFFLFLLRKKVY